MDSTRPLAILFPGAPVPQGIPVYFLSKQATGSIEAFDDTLEQMVAFVKQEAPSKIVAIVPKRFRLDILAYLGEIVDRIEFLDPS